MVHGSKAKKQPLINLGHESILEKNRSNNLNSTTDLVTKANH